MKTYRFKTLLIALLCFTGFYGHAQTWNWATHSNSERRFNVHVVSDQNNYIYAAGNDSLGFVLTKYKPNGVKIWSKTDSVTQVQQLSIDAAGNLFIAATVHDFAGTLIISAKLDSAGNRLWTKGIYTPPAPNDGGTGFLFAGAADEAGNTYLAGNFKAISNLTQFDTIPLTNLAPDNYFLAKYNSAGKIQWLRFFNDPVYAVAAGPQGSYFVETGTEFQKYAANGTLIWQQSFSGMFNLSVPYGLSNKLKSDAQGNLFVLGSKLAKYNTNGAVVWTRVNQSVNSAGNDFSLTRSGNVLLTGYFNGSLTFGFGGPTITAGAAGPSIFVAQFSGVNGSADWVKQANNSGSIVGEAIYSSPNGNCVVAGNFNATSTFDQHSITGKGFFVARLSAGTLGISEMKSSAIFQIFPNPATSEVFINSKAKAGLIEIYNLSGQKVFKTEFTAETKLNIADYPAGMYLVKLTSEGKTETKKLIVTH